MYPQPDQPDEQDSSSPSPSSHSEDDDQSPGETALLPKTILGGKDFQPGEEVVLKIVALHDDEVEVSYAPEKSGSADESENMDGGSASEMGRSQNKLTSMGSNSGGY